MHERRPESFAPFLHALGVPELAPATVPFDPGYDAATVEGHLQQSAHMMRELKLSMSGWFLSDPSATERKVAAARRYGLAVTAGGGPFEIACVRGCLDTWLDLCAGVGISRVEAASGFTDIRLDPAAVVRSAADRGLEVQFELGRKHDGAVAGSALDLLIDIGRRWLDAGATCLVVEAREDAHDVGLFRADGGLDLTATDRLVDRLGLGTLVFEAPTKASQFALLDHLGPTVVLGNVRLEEVLRVEGYRRRLHPDAFVRHREDAATKGR